MRIVHLNANDWIGGAAIAAKRLRDGQRHHGMDSVLWVGDKQQEDPYTFTSEHPYRAKLRFVSERLYFRFFEKSARQRFA